MRHLILPALTAVLLSGCVAYEYNDREYRGDGSNYHHRHSYGHHYGNQERYHKGDTGPVHGNDPRWHGNTKR